MQSPAFSLQCWGEVWAEHLRERHISRISSFEEFKDRQARGPPYRFRLSGLTESDNCLTEIVIDSALALNVRGVRNQLIHDDDNWRGPRDVLFRRVMARYNELAEENTKNLRVSFDSLLDELWLKILESPSVKWDTRVALNQTCKRLHSLWQDSEKHKVDVWILYLRSLFPGQENMMNYWGVREKWLYEPLREVDFPLTEASCMILTPILEEMDELVDSYHCIGHDVEHIAQNLSPMCPAPQGFGTYPWCLVHYSSKPDHAAALKTSSPALAEM